MQRTLQTFTVVKLAGEPMLKLSIHTLDAGLAMRLTLRVLTYCEVPRGC